MILSRTAQTDAEREQLLDRTEAIDWGLDAVNLTLVPTPTHTPTWLSSFTITHQQKPSNRQQRLEQ